MKGFSKFIGKLPFAGKIWIRPLALKVYQSTTASERRQKFLYLMAILVLFVLSHAIQAMAGIYALSFDSSFWAKAISALFAVVNVCVVLTQIYLGIRVTHFCICAPYPRVKRTGNNYSTVEVVTMFAVTSSGQIIFCLFYLWYR